MNAIYKTIAGTALVAAAFMSNAQAAQLNGWQLVLPGQTVAPVDQLGFNGESFVKNTFAANNNDLTFTDNGIFNITTMNEGESALDFGQLTANYTNGSGFGSISSGAITFNAGGVLDIYYNPTRTFGRTGQATVANRNGATSGTKIASFSQIAGGGGSINPDGTPSANGMLTLHFVSTFFADGIWLDADGNDLMEGATFGFVTSNASEDGGNISAVVRETLSGSATTVNTPPSYFFVSNGGQLKLEVNDVPEPASLAIFGLGLLGVAGLRRRKA